MITSTIIASFATLEEARSARVEMSKNIDGLSIVFQFNTYKLVRHEVTSKNDAMAALVENSSCYHRNSSKSRKKRRSQSPDFQLFTE